METSVIVTVAGLAVTIIINVIMLSFWAGSIRQVVATVVATVDKHDVKLESHGSAIESLKSDVRLIGVETGAFKYVKQIS